MGRHARTLSKDGYSVIGIDRDADLIAKARGLACGSTYVNADVAIIGRIQARSILR
jgi:Trk K+ transport system NAD-binding subunit